MLETLEEPCEAFYCNLEGEMEATILEVMYKNSVLELMKRSIYLKPERKAFRTFVE